MLNDTTDTVGRILALAVRTGKKQAMRQISRTAATADGGLDGDVPSRPDRGITFLSSKQWSDVTGELDVSLPWHTRRANVLIDCDSLQHLIGRQIRAGQVTVSVIAETKPCGLMDEIHNGLRNALTPACRGGVYGRILQGGPLAVGDPITILS